MFTLHAIQRMQQRGVTEPMVDLVLDYGSVDYHRGAEVISITKRDWKKICRDKACPKQLLDKLRNCYLVWANGFVVTVGHKTTHFKTNRS